MSYHVTAHVSNIHILGKNVKACLKAINALEENHHFGSLVDALRWWDFMASTDEERGGVTVNCHEGDGWCEPDKMLEAIAPFVQPRCDSKIECVGEEGEQWRYLFEDGKLRRQNAKLTWED